jgi:predicted DNA-binding helix-hairpin-helix protein
VPGIGPQGSRAIVSARRRGQLHDLRDLRALGVLANRAAPFIVLNGRRPAYQPQLL